jgi:hypothetical protein
MTSVPAVFSLTTKAPAEHARIGKTTMLLDGVQVTDLGRFEELTSPVMTKIGEAFLYSKAAFMAPADKPLLPNSKVVNGAASAIPRTLQQSAFYTRSRLACGPQKQSSPASP